MSAKKEKPKHKSLARSYVRLTTLVIAIGLAIFGGILIAFSKEYFDHQLWDSLHKKANYTSNYVTSKVIETVEGFVPQSQALENAFSIISENGDSTIILTNTVGDFILFTKTPLTNKDAPNKQVPSDTLAILTAGNYYKDQSNLGGFFMEDAHIVGVPVFSPKDDAVIGYVFLASPGSRPLAAFLKSILQIFILGAIAVLAFTFTAVSLITDRILAPIKDVSEAAKSFGDGDLKARVIVEPDTYDEIVKLSTTFNNMAASIAQGEKSTRSFVANVSHELKTPMTTIAGFIDGMLDGTIDEADRPRYLGIVSEEIKRLARLVSSMLNLSKIEAGEMQINPASFDINQLVIQIILSFEQKIELKNLDIKGLDADNKQFVYADKDMIYQCLYNLIENAIKFAEEDGYIEISYLSEAGFLQTSIKNSGKGLSKDEIQQVFERFYKADRSRSVDKTGVGLGLYIVKTIVTLHGGEIFARSLENQYSEFVIALPEKKSD